MQEFIANLCFKFRQHLEEVSTLSSILYVFLKEFIFKYWFNKFSLYIISSIFVWPCYWQCSNFAICRITIWFKEGSRLSQDSRQIRWYRLRIFNLEAKMDETGVRDYNGAEVACSAEACCGQFQYYIKQFYEVYTRDLRCFWISVFYCLLLSANYFASLAIVQACE